MRIQVLKIVRTVLPFDCTIVTDFEISKLHLIVEQTSQNNTKHGLVKAMAASELLVPSQRAGQHGIRAWLGHALIL